MSNIAATANGIDSFLVIGKQADINTKAPANSGKTMRRTTAMFKTTADKYSSTEIRRSQQQNDTRLGNFRSEGNLKAPFSCGSFADLIAGILRKAFAAGGATAAANTIAAVADGFTRTAGSFIADGHKANTIIRPSGFTAPAVANNGRNYFVYKVEALKLHAVPLNGDATTVKAAGDNVAIAMAGKVSLVPQTGHTKDYFTAEMADPEIGVYRTFRAQLVDSMAINVPPNDMTEITFAFKGLEEDPSTGVAYFNAPAAQLSTDNFAGADALLSVNEELTVICTAMQVTVNAQVKQDPVIGRKYVGGVSRGRVIGSGQFSVLFQDASYLDYFRAETEVSAGYAMAGSSLPGADAVAFSFPRLKITDADVSDGEINKVVTCQFDLLEYNDGGTPDGYHNTTLAVQDTTL